MLRYQAQKTERLYKSRIDHKQRLGELQNKLSSLVNTKEREKTTEEIKFLQKVMVRMEAREKRRGTVLPLPSLDDVYQTTTGAKDPTALQRELASHAAIEFVEPNYLAQVYFTPNDPRFQAQYSHRVTQAAQAWDIDTGKSEVVIAIVDSGVDYTHEDLAANIWRDAQGNPGGNFVDINVADYIARGYRLIPGEQYGPPNADPRDVNGHGTLCAGIAAAKGNNGIGVSGICHHCRIMPARGLFAITDPTGITGGIGEFDDIANAIRYAVDNGADIISMSFGGYGFSLALQEAITYANNRGVILVAAAGNEARTVLPYPAALEGVVAVSATTEFDALAGYSNRGPDIDVAAPGSFILSTVPKQGVLVSPDGYRFLSGTSMAAPYVAGLAGLVLSGEKEQTVNEVVSIIQTSSDDLAPPGKDTNFGHGRVNAFKAVQSVRRMTAFDLGLDGNYVGRGNSNIPSDGPDFHVAVNNLRQIPTRVTIKSDTGGVWEIPYNGQSWTIHAEYDNQGKGDFWFENAPSNSFRIEVEYFDGITRSTRQANAVKAGQIKAEQNVAAFPNLRKNGTEQILGAFEVNVPEEQVLINNMKFFIQLGGGTGNVKDLSDIKLTTKSGYVLSPVAQPQSVNQFQGTVMFNLQSGITTNYLPTGKNVLYVKGKISSSTSLSPGAGITLTTFPRTDWAVIGASGQKPIIANPKSVSGGTMILEPNPPLEVVGPGPNALPLPGQFDLPLEVSLSTVISGAEIFYTTDGSTPTSASAKYNGPLYVAATTTIKAIAINQNGKSEVTSVTYTIGKLPNTDTNVALSSAGAVASSSGALAQYPPLTFPVSAINDDKRSGLGWERDGGWNDDGRTIPPWVQINFNGSKTINRDLLYTLQDKYTNPIDSPDPGFETLTFDQYGITDFEVQGWDGSKWVRLGAPVTGNNLVKRTVSFPAYTTTQIRVVANKYLAGYARIVEVEAWGQSAPISTQPLGGRFVGPDQGKAAQNASPCSSTNPCDGVPNFHIQLTNVKNSIVRLRIENEIEGPTKGIWEFPANPQGNWLPYKEQTGQTAEVWIGEYSSNQFTVKVWYGSNPQPDEIVTVNKN